MNNPSLQELTEYLDGTLNPVRYREIETMISTSPGVQKELLLLKEMKKTIRSNIIPVSSKKFTAAVMKEILPVQQESLWFRLIKNSSNLFAMILVLSMIGIVMVSSSSPSNSNVMTKNIETYTTAYNSAIETMSSWAKQFSRPVNQMTNTASGKFFLLGLFAFFIFMIVDDIVDKKYFHSGVKN